jgi:hypothetical protein
MIMQYTLASADEGRDPPQHFSDPQSFETAGEKPQHEMEKGKQHEEGHLRLNRSAAVTLNGYVKPAPIEKYQ